MRHLTAGDSLFVLGAHYYSFIQRLLTHPPERLRGHFAQTLMLAQTCAYKLLEGTLFKYFSFDNKTYSLTLVSCFTIAIMQGSR